MNINDIYPTASGERTGWRDEAISLRHREWGVSCPATDIDFLLVEYSSGEPKALIEYKMFTAAPTDYRSSQNRALRSLADKARLPLFVAYYWPETWSFQVYAFNDTAKLWLNGNRVHMTEVDFVRLLHSVRSRWLPDELKATLHTVPPPATPILGDELLPV